MFWQKWYKWSKGFVSWWLLRKKKKTTTYFAHWTGVWRLAAPEILFCKMPSKRNERGIFFPCLIFFLHFCAFCIGDQSELTKHPPPPPMFLFFHEVTTPLTQQHFFLTPPPPRKYPHLIINDWSHRSCSFLNILLFKILPQICYNQDAEFEKGPIFRVQCPDNSKGWI